jgi:hypothetical protein
MMKLKKPKLPLILALAAASAALVPYPASAARAKPNRIAVSYVTPKDPAHQPIYDRLKEFRPLEKMKVILSPFRLPHTLLIKTEGCDGESNAWYDDGAITICYEYIDEIWRTAPAETTADGVTPLDARVAPVVDTVLHEFGHAIFDILALPVFGREEDAADQVAAYMALQLGKDESRRHIGAVAYAYMTEVKAAAPLQLKQFADEHGTPAQRFYNVLCIAYGADDKQFGDLVAKGYLPKDRSEGCEDEYRQAARAFQKLVEPHIDQRLVKKVLSRSWMPDPARRIPRQPAAGPSTQSN